MGASPAAVPVREPLPEQVVVLEPIGDEDPPVPQGIVVRNRPELVPSRSGRKPMPAQLPLIASRVRRGSRVRLPFVTAVSKRIHRR